ncbi:Na+/H+ antiporter subunit C [Pseudoduganella umbonata]|uniref:Multicomponent K+:H+ antiporter subunit C n=1 Tax=Pseudoduganella umbonata TaxID=864828 RepID=A0A4P8HW00_9BURK|nr:Na+/H+ antiporter subunit C [Pseudoduganella umbonata]MBB3221924.1 multicomponent K+:H+ antiporter subunit C [Pseudoduganella umbonata]QCP14279.1 Na+/H+ antiporter subunit C [Pseudoduganella umbonata]
METVLALGIGIVFGAGIWLVLRPRTFQVLIGLMLMSYAVNLFIFAMGRLAVDRPPLTPAGAGVSAANLPASLPAPLPDPAALADPVPQALVLTAIVIGFATTALYLVVMIGARGLAGTDHVDGEEPDE